MEQGSRYGDYALQAQEKRLREREQAFEDSLADDLGLEFTLPIGHRPTENLDTDGLEQASVDTHLSASNVGFKLLQKMGWKGKGLGKDEQGIVEPIKAGSRDPKLGLGKQEQDDFYTCEENVHRKKLEVELEDSEEKAKKREVVAEREQKIQEEVKEIRKVFFCELCNKQYKLAMEFETHLSSYDHNHKKRFKEMSQSQSNARSREDREKREQVRQEKELARIALLAQRQQQQEQESRASGGAAAISATAVHPNVGSSTSGIAAQGQRGSLKFGFGTKSAIGPKVSLGGISKKHKVAVKVASVFQNNSDDES